MWDNSEEAAEPNDPCIPMMESSPPGSDQADVSRKISSCFPTLYLPREDCSVMGLFRYEKRTTSPAMEINWMSFFKVDIPIRPMTLNTVEDKRRASNPLLLRWTLANQPIL